MSNNIGHNSDPNGTNSELTDAEKMALTTIAKMAADGAALADQLAAGASA